MKFLIQFFFKGCNFICVQTVNGQKVGCNLGFLGIARFTGDVHTPYSGFYLLSDGSCGWPYENKSNPNKRSRIRNGAGNGRA